MTVLALLKCTPCCAFQCWLIWSYWVDSSRIKAPPSPSAIHMAIIRSIDKICTAKMLTLLCLPSLTDLIVLSWFLPLETSPTLSSIHMTIIRRLVKTSTAKTLTLLCLPSLAELIVLSGFLPLEIPSSWSSMHMAIIRRLDKTTSKTLIPCDFSILMKIFLKRME